MAENKLEEKPNLAELIQHVRVGSKWHLLGVLLELDEVKLNDIRRMTEGSDFKALKMFQLWLNTNPNATRRQVIDALKKEPVKEMTVADNYEKILQSEPSAQVFEDTTDQIAPLDQSDRTSYEHNAISIFQCHFRRLQQFLQNPISVARFLHNEKIISEAVLNSVKSASQTLGDRRIILLTALQDAINTNYQFLKVFAEVLLKFTENVPLANAILKDYRTIIENDTDYYDALKPALPDREIELGQPTTENAMSCRITHAMKPLFTEIRSKFGRTFFRVRKAISKNSPLIEDLKTFLQDSFPDLKPQISHVKTIDEILDIILKKCTLIDISYLEIIVEEFDIQEAKSYIEEYKSYIKEICKTLSVKLCLDESFNVKNSSSLKGETATFIFDWDPDDCTINDIEEILSVCLEELSIHVQVETIKTINIEERLKKVTTEKDQKTKELQDFNIELKMLKKMNGAKTLEYQSVLQRKEVKIDQLTREKEAANKLLVDSQKDVEKLQEIVSKLTGELNEKKTMITKLIESRKSLISRIAKVSAWFKSDKVKSDNLEFSQRLDEIVTDETSADKQKEINQLTREKEDANKLLVATQENLEILQEKVSTLTWQLNEREKNITQLTENMKDSNKKLEMQKKMNGAQTLEYQSVLQRKEEKINHLTREKEATNKLLVDTQENLKILHEEVSTLTWQLNQREKNSTQWTENMKDSNKKLEMQKKMSRAKTLEIEKYRVRFVQQQGKENRQGEINQLSREKEATDKQVVDTQENQEILQEKASPLTCQLNERQTKITQLIESRKGLETLKQTDSLIQEKGENSTQVSIIAGGTAVTTKDVECQFNYLVPSLDQLEYLDGTGVHLAGKTLFLIQGESTQLLNWEEYGLRINVPHGMTPPGEICEISIAAIVGGKFEFPSGTSLVSAIYAISVSRALLQPVQLSIQHCVSLETQEHTSYLSFVTADLYQSVLPYKFKLEQGGQFYPGHQYGSISTQFSLKAIVKAVLRPIRWLLGYEDDEDSTSPEQVPLSQSSSSDDDSLFVDASEVTVSMMNKDEPSLRCSPVNLYVGQVVYEVESQTQWLMRFLVSLHLDALLQYIHTSLPNAKKDVHIYFKFQEENGYIELIIREEDHPFPQGWNIYPHFYPTRISQVDVDMLSDQSPPQFPSCLMTVSATPRDTTVPVLQYRITLNGIKLNVINEGEALIPEICIVRSLATSTRQSVRGLENTDNGTQNCEIGRRALVQCTDIIVESNIDPITLARRLYSKEIISEDVYKIVKDKKTGYTSTDRLDYILDDLKDRVKHDASAFTFFLDILRDDSFNRQDLADKIMSKYKELST